MGYDQHDRPTSSGTLVAVIVVGLVLAILGITVVAFVGLFWARSSIGRVEAVAMEQQMVAELRHAEARAQLEVAEARIAAAPDPRLSFEIQIDREGNTTVDGERVGLDELKAQIAKLKDETSNVFTVRINVDSNCPVKHVVTVLDVLVEVGDIDYRVVASKEELPAC